MTTDVEDRLRANRDADIAVLNAKDAEIERLLQELKDAITASEAKDRYIKQLELQIERLREALSTLVADWEAVPDDLPVPEEINVNEHWDAARAALRRTV
jgi:uncharacterized coiled-coil protein SlyX